MFGLVGVAAVIYPFRLAAVWAAGGASRIAGVPLIAVWGGVTRDCDGNRFVRFLVDPFSGVGKSPLQIALNVGTPVPVS